LTVEDECNQENLGKTIFNKRKLKPEAKVLG